MPPQTRSGAVFGIMKPLTQFHPFRRLPIELQLMIWALWRQDRAAIRHYLCLEPYGRFYAALDIQQGKYVNPTSRSGKRGAAEEELLDRMGLHKIRFTNGVAFTNDLYRIYSTVHGLPGFPEPNLGIAPTDTYVNFERDVFFAENTNYRYPGRLRFLFRNIGTKMPHEVVDWSKRIQKLAMFVCPQSITLDDLDRKALSQLTGLKTVFVVFRTASQPELRKYIMDPSKREEYTEDFVEKNITPNAFMDKETWYNFIASWRDEDVEKNEDFFYYQMEHLEAGCQLKRRIDNVFKEEDRMTVQVHAVADIFHTY
ncbi:hypothetical protein F5B20DRAFT_586706 [Whalleya microplaca]|nr:hypothetical protein F5B20DRAFT_586706 [Whalleya microplaca]